MTRRFGYCLIGVILGAAPLAGCAPWSRFTSSGCPNGDGSSLMDFWSRQFHPRGPQTPVQHFETDVSPLVHETNIPTPEVMPSERPQVDQAQDKNLITLDPLPAEPAPPILIAPANNPPDSLPVQTGTLTPPRIDIQPALTVATIAPPDVVKREPVVDAMQAFIDNHQSEALQLLRKYEAPTQELFLRLLPVMALMTQKSIDQLSAPEVAVLNEQLQGLYESLRPRSKLTIAKACFCEWFKSYGLYQPVPKDHAFLASTTRRPGDFVQLYVELSNFASEAKNGFYTTRLSASIEILDQQKKRAWFYQYEDKEQTTRSRTPLHDYGATYALYVPSELTPGTYTLVIRIKDITRPDQQREASQALEFRVTSMARVP